jgi:hypothetical protein
MVSIPDRGNNIQTGFGSHPASYTQSRRYSDRGVKIIYSPPFSAEVKNDGAIAPLPHASSCMVVNQLRTGIILLLGLKLLFLTFN